MALPREPRTSRGASDSLAALGTSRTTRGRRQQELRLDRLHVAGWAASGTVFGFSETWQLIINTGTTIVAFLMVFLIQNSQNRGTKALHLKLDELLRAVEGARDGQFVDLEDRTEQELDAVKAEMLAECAPGESAEEHARHSPLRRHRRRREGGTTGGSASRSAPA